MKNKNNNIVKDFDVINIESNLRELGCALQELRERQREVDVVYNELMDVIQYNENLQDRLDEVTQIKATLTEEIKALNLLLDQEKNEIKCTSRT